MLIKNFGQLSQTPERRVALEVVEAGLEAIDPVNSIPRAVQLAGNTLTVNGTPFDLAITERIFLLGFGKGSARISKIIEALLGDRLTAGTVIDVTPETFAKISFTLGTHPLPSPTNLGFTAAALQLLSGLTERDLVLVVICGGGSALFEQPAEGVSLEQQIGLFRTLTERGADIFELNTVRKHLSRVKGGQLVQHLFPARVVSLVASDVPGNDLATIASGPTMPDMTTITDAQLVLQKYQVAESYALVETPKETKYFERVTNAIILSNRTALEAMAARAQAFGYLATIHSDQLHGRTTAVTQLLLDQALLAAAINTTKGFILLAGGETTVEVLGQGTGGRNQECALRALLQLDGQTTFVALDSDGWDNTSAAGAIVDANTLARAQAQGLNPQQSLATSDSYTFFQAVGDAIMIDRLPSNVADLFIVLRKL